MITIGYKPQELFEAMQQVMTLPEDPEAKKKVIEGFENAFWQCFQVGFEASNGVPLHATRTYIKLMDALEKRKKDGKPSIKLEPEHFLTIYDFFNKFDKWNVHISPIVLLVESKLKTIVDGINKQKAATSEGIPHAIGPLQHG